MVCSELRAGVDFLCSSDRGGLPGETSCGHLGDPGIGMRVQAETPGPPARGPAYMPALAPATRKSWLGWKGAQRRNMLSRCAPDSNQGCRVCTYQPCPKDNRAFCFSDDLAP